MSRISSAVLSRSREGLLVVWSVGEVFVALMMFRGSQGCSRSDGGNRVLVSHIEDVKPSYLECSRLVDGLESAVYICLDTRNRNERVDDKVKVRYDQSELGRYK